MSKSRILRTKVIALNYEICNHRFQFYNLLSFFTLNPQKNLSTTDLSIPPLDLPAKLIDIWQEYNSPQQQLYSDLGKEASMGGNQSRAKPLNVATLNFAGIAHSPFEFLSGNKQQKQQFGQLNQIYQRIYEVEYGEVPSRQTLDFHPQRRLSNIEKCMQRERYSPLYRRDVGIHNGRLMNRPQFMSRWTEQFEKNYQYVKFGKAPSKQQIKHSRIFDYLIFQTFVEYIYTFKLAHLSEELKSWIQSNIKRQKELQEKQKEKRKKQIQSYGVFEAEKLWEKEELQAQSQNRKKKERQKPLQRNCYINAVVQYQLFMQSHFSKAFLNFDTKFRSLKHVLQNNDILFLQDASDELINALKNEGKVNIITKKGTDCVILLKNENDNSKFSDLYDHERILNLENWKGKDKESMKVFDANKLNYNIDKEKQDTPTTAICFVDRLILLNIHLSSVKDKELKESRESKEPKKQKESKRSCIKVMEHLLEIRRTFDRHVNIIAAGDFNSFFETTYTEPRDIQTANQFKTIFRIYPENKEQLTTRKTRTFLQSQLNKAGEQDKLCRDFIITDLKMVNPRITVLGDIIQNNRFDLLTEKHPFDHAIVSATIVRDT